MAILVDHNTKIIIQGMTGQVGSFHAKQTLEYGTKLLGGVSPGKGGTIFLDLPVFNTVLEAKNNLNPDATVIFVPAPFAGDAILEAINAEIPLIVVITEFIPIWDMLKVKKALLGSKSRVIGPNSPGMITPGGAKLGIIPGFINKNGKVGVMSRSGTMMYEAICQTEQFGQSTSIGVGGDPIIGSTFADLLPLYWGDPETEILVMIGEIGGHTEIQAAKLSEAKGHPKPIISYISGRTAPKGVRMGHAGAISEGDSSADNKVKALEELGIIMVESPDKIGQTVAKYIKKR